MKNDVVSMNNVQPVDPGKPTKPVIVSTNTTQPAPIHHPEPGKRTAAQDPIFMGVKAELKAKASAVPASEPVPELPSEQPRAGRPKKTK